MATGATTLRETVMKTYDSWDLNTLREAAEFNRANPDPEHQSTIDWVEAELAAAEAQRLHTTAVPVADEEPATRRPSDGSSSCGGQSDSPTGAQQSFIRSLCQERGVDADALLATIKDKRQASQAIDRLKAQPRQEQERPATERQTEYLQDLLASREHSFDLSNAEVARTLSTFKGASLAIDLLQRAPRVSKVADHGIRHGRYAFQPADGSPAQFYRVAQNGRITVIAGPQEHPYNGQLNEALKAIAADTKSAAALYGQLIGSCGRCGLTLTDETSRAQGLGPICIGKSDW